jgi:uncharacterized protein (TIGR02147 family)
MKAGVRSSGFFANVLCGKRNLTPSVAIRFASALKLKKNEADYFQNLVGYCQAHTVDERTYFCEKMIACADVAIRKLEQDRFEFYGRWYYSAIRELLFFHDFGGDYEALGKMLTPSIPAADARRAIELLERLKLIHRGPDGRYRQSEPLLTSGTEFRSLYIANFQRETMRLAAEALDRFPATVRDSSTLTMTLSRESFKIAKRELGEFRKRLLALAEKDANVDRVYQFNFQLFPLSRFSIEGAG